MPALREPPDVEAGTLEVGRKGFEIIINHSDLETDEHGVGHIVFSPRQARHLAKLLNKHTDDALREWKVANPARIAR